MTDIREQAAKAAREKLGVPPSDDEAYPCQTCERDTFIHAYLLGHAAGFERGARALLEWALSTGVLSQSRHVAALTQEQILARFLASAPGTGLAQGKDEEGKP
jgi:hypothetical protein